MCDRVGVLYAGRLVEEGPVDTVLPIPRHPYTVGLLRCIPARRRPEGSVAGSTRSRASCRASARPLSAASSRDRCASGRRPLPDGGAAPLRARRPARRRCFYHDRAQTLPREHGGRPRVAGGRPRRGAPARVRLTWARCSSSTGHDVHALVGVQRGDLAGRDARARRRVGERQDDARAHAARDRRHRRRVPCELDGRDARPLRYQKRTTDDLRSLQIVFQNPDSALNRRHSVRRILRALDEEADRDQRLRGRTLALSELVEPVRITERYAHRRSRCSSPVASSSGSRSPGRSPATRSSSCATSRRRALDVSVQAAILNLLVELQDQKQRLVPVHQPRPRRRALHLRPDRGALPRSPDGAGRCRVVFGGPHHPYTEALLSAVPDDRRRRARAHPARGRHPERCEPAEWAASFHTRCPRKVGAICETTEPPLVEVEGGHLMRCHIPIDELRTLQRKETVEA